MKNTILSTCYSSMCRWFPLVILFLGMHFFGYAQKEWSDDPMKKPQIWKDLVKNPTDMKLWEKYCGKPMDKMSMKQLEEVTMWKQELMLRKLADEEAIVGMKLEGDVFIDDVAFGELMAQIEEAKKPRTKGQQTKGSDGKVRHVTRIEMAGMEAMILQEQGELRELKQNINANFALIEEYYKEIYQEYGETYVYYKEKYPNGKYSEVKWVEDQEKQIRALKMRQIQELRKKFVVASGG